MGSSLEGKSKSKAQQKFFAVVRAYQNGDLKKSEVTKSVIDAADNMSKKEVKEFASTKTKNLPYHKNKEEKVNENAHNDLVKAMIKYSSGNMSSAEANSKIKNFENTIPDNKYLKKVIKISKPQFNLFLYETLNKILK